MIDTNSKDLPLPVLTLLDWKISDRDPKVYEGHGGRGHPSASFLQDDKGYAFGRSRFKNFDDAVRAAEQDWLVNSLLEELRSRVVDLGGKRPYFLWEDVADGWRGVFDGSEIRVKRPGGLTKIVGEVLGFLPFKGNPTFDVEAAKNDQERIWLIGRIYRLAAERAVSAANPVGEKAPEAAAATPAAKPSETVDLGKDASPVVKKPRQRKAKTPGVAEQPAGLERDPAGKTPRTRRRAAGAAVEAKAEQKSAETVPPKEAEAKPARTRRKPAAETGKPSTSGAEPVRRKVGRPAKEKPTEAAATAPADKPVRKPRQPRKAVAEQ